MKPLGATLEKLITKQQLPWSLKGSTVWVNLPTGRVQAVQLTLEGDLVVFTSVVLGTRQVTKTAKRWRELARLAWHRNTSSELVTFCFDKQDRLIGRIESPASTLDEEEIEASVTQMARDCDRFEYLLSGADRF